jgi:glycosyltransferase involved in cell wall biosynthesis
VTSPRIVVGMGVFNEEQYLEETIPAVLAQTMPDFRLLILENGSTDRSADILARFSDADPRVNVVRAPINMPPAEAANYGWGLAMPLVHGARLRRHNGTRLPRGGARGGGR